MIKPTIGRIVLFWLEDKQKEPLAAVITKVIRDDLICVTVFFPDNVPMPCIDIPINREIKQYPYAEWMDYQKGQAAKTEELEKQIKKVEKEGYTAGPSD